MTTFKEITLEKISSTSGITDAFGRMRTSEPSTLIDTKQLYDNLPLVYDDQEVSGSGTGSTHDTDAASSTMTVSNATAGKRVRQTFRRFNYQTGKSHLVFITVTLGAGVSGNVKEVGYGDDNNGIFLQLDGTTLIFTKRSSTSGSPIDSDFAQTLWNIDKLDGTGDSGITLDVTKSQILILDFEWLGVGIVRCGFVIDGIIYYAHAFLNANNIAGVYMSTPNLPIRYSIENTGSGAADSLEHICSTVISEGGQDRIGVVRSITRGSDDFSNAGDGDICPLVSIRLKSTHIGASIDLLKVSVLATAAADYEVVIMFNPTVAGTDAASWTNETNGALQYDISRDNTNTLSGGTILDSEFVSQSNSLGGFSNSIESAQQLGSAIDGTVDEIVLAVRNLSGSNKNFYGSITTRQLI